MTTSTNRRKEMTEAEFKLLQLALERIKQLEERVAELERRIVALDGG